MQFQQNEKLSLDLRSVVGGGSGGFSRSPTQTAWVAAGATDTNEQYHGEPGQSVPKPSAASQGRTF
jgi:hypothetical protein